ncbi:MAG: hypothetical protein GOV15_03635, partial [Candidatus Diapherotrites archaeon]|nr:hypothetical protein [Candidatus Diapherotrites archaeon]
YLQRQTIHAAQDLKTVADSSTRDAEGNVVQFLYGDDGAFTQKTKNSNLFTIEELER